MPTLPALLLLSLTGCGLVPGEVGYYDGRWDPPEISELSKTSQNGNVSGNQVTIRGSGFGDDSAALMVQFGSRNATIQSLKDDEIVVEVPPGPIGGGTVPVVVGTYTGYAESEYSYDMGSDIAKGEGNITPDAVGYIVVNNYWESCLGGLSNRLGDDYGADGCDTVAYMGSTGIDGVAEAIDFPYPRLHSGYQGWSGATDLAGGSWRVERPGENAYAGSVSDYHVELGDVSLRNSFYSEEPGYCVDLADSATYRYGGGTTEFPESFAVGGGLPVVTEAEGTSCEEGAYYDADELDFCQRRTEEGVTSFVYETDWPVNANFFAANAKGDDPAEVTLRLPDIGVESVELVLPEPLIVYNTKGFEPVLNDETKTGAQELWGAFGTLEHCFDEAGDGESLDDVALRFEWPVTETEYPELNDTVLGVRTYVRASITQLSLGWFGGLSYPVRATITVEDAHETYEVDVGRNKTEERSVIEIPAEVMYQFPTIRFPGGGLGLVSPDSADYGYMFIEFQRVTEYTLQTDVGPVVFAYTTGDFGFFEWVNPTDDGCHDCIDNDDDGYADANDPDCEAGIDEVGTGTTACNNGVDDDGDGDVDSDDVECLSSADNDESNCSNNIDDDGDGYRDEDDDDCVRGENEAFADDCVDDSDNDLDGWVDAADPDCSGDSTELGFGTSECNDGVDNDNDGATDSLDAACTSATDASETD